MQFLKEVSRVPGKKSQTFLQTKLINESYVREASQIHFVTRNVLWTFGGGGGRGFVLSVSFVTKNWCFYTRLSRIDCIPLLSA